MSLGVFTGGLLLTLAVIYMKRRRRLRAHLAQPDMTLSARQSATLYEPSTMRCTSLLREQTLSKEEQYQLMTPDCGSRTVRVDLLAAAPICCDSPLRQPPRPPPSTCYQVACQTCSRPSHIASKYYECPQPPPASAYPP